MAMKLWFEKKHYRFSRNWFRGRNFETFRSFVYPEWHDKPANYLEVGVFEGQSLCWMLERVLTHPDSKATGIDTWLMSTKLDQVIMDKVMEKAYDNTAPFPNCNLIRGCSAEVLRRMLRKEGWEDYRKNCFDICMIDGNHHQYAVLDDALMCLQLVRSGGWILFDDVENQRRKSQHVREGLIMFLNQVGKAVKFLWKDRYVECYEVQ